MKVIVLGAGVIGVTTAWYLASGGAEVRVLDRQPGPGMETSFANAGELSYGMTSPWAAPGIPMKAVKWLFMRHRPLFIWPMVDPAMWAWGAADARRTATRRAYRLQQGPDGADLELQPRRADRPARRGAARLRPARAGHAAALPHREAAQGVEGRPGGAGRVRLALRGARPRRLHRGRARARACRRQVRRRAAADGRPHRRLPDVHAGAGRQGGGDRRRASATASRSSGSPARATGSPGSRPSTAGDAPTPMSARSGPTRRSCCAAIGIRLPIYPIKGYSITLPVTDDAAAPQSTLMDETHKVAITRLGERIRVAGQAEIIGYNRRARPHGDRHRALRRDRPLPQGRRRLDGPRAGPASGR